MDSRDLEYDNRRMLGLILKKIEERGITEKECLVGSQVNTSFLSDWKKEKIKSPPFDKIYRISRYLNLSLDRLAGSDQPQKEPEPPDLSEQEQFMIGSFRKMDALEQQIILGKISEIIYQKKNLCGAQQKPNEAEEIAGQVVWNLFTDSDHSNQITKSAPTAKKD
jgi:transcriptional regulator with XRE-family HTH domain